MALAFFEWVQFRKILNLSKVARKRIRFSILSLKNNQGYTRFWYECQLSHTKVLANSQSNQKIKRDARIFCKIKSQLVPGCSCTFRLVLNLDLCS